MRACFYTLGCKVNQYETQAMRRQFADAGWETAEYAVGQVGNDEQVLVVNSCTVTAESDRKLRQLLRRMRRDNPHAIIVLTGCMPQAFPEKAAALTEADIVLGNAERAAVLPHVQNFLRLQRRVVNVPQHDRAFEPMEIAEFEGRTRAFVKIEDGCNRFCSYCIIPYARGRVRSKPTEALKQEVQTLGKNGYREIVLVGINLTAYGQDIGSTLADAVDAAASVPEVERVRLGSLEPEDLTPQVIARLKAQPKLCPQFHLSLQSGCDATLKRMRRRYDVATYADICRRLREAFPSCALTTDVMVGFAGETDEEFEQSLQFVRSVGFADAHVFAYSRREGTPAAQADGQVTASVKARRSRQMIAACAKTRQAYLQSLLGTEATLLTERHTEDGGTEGYTENYVPVKVAQTLPLDALCRVRLTALDGDGCIAELTESL